MKSLYEKNGKINLIDISICYFLIVAGSFFVSKEGSYAKSYVFFVLFILIFLIITKGKMIYLKHYISVIPFAFLSIWIYGFITGLIRGNALTLILSNFIGILLYVMFYCLYSLKVSTEKMTRLLIIISSAVTILTLVAFVDMFVLKTAFVLHIPFLKDFQMALTVEYGSRELIYISYMYCLYKILFMKQFKIRYVLMVVCAWIAEIICIRSGGDTLAICALTGVLLVIWAYKKWDKRIFYCAVILGVALVVMIFLIPQSPVYELFSPEDEGNIVRYRQIEVLLKEMNFWGHGLGATFKETLGSSYGIEVIYLNIFHKFGVFAVVILVAYIYTVLAAVVHILKEKDDAKSVVPLACMGYLIPSLANPMLFAPPHVLAHCVALLLIYEGKIKRSNENLVSRNEFL